MRVASIVPEQVKAMGLNMQDVFTLAIEDAISRN